MGVSVGAHLVVRKLGVMEEDGEKGAHLVVLKVRFWRRMVKKRLSSCLARLSPRHTLFPTPKGRNPSMSLKTVNRICFCSKNRGYRNKINYLF